MESRDFGFWVGVVLVAMFVLWLSGSIFTLFFGLISVFFTFFFGLLKLAFSKAGLVILGACLIAYMLQHRGRKHEYYL